MKKVNKIIFDLENHINKKTSKYVLILFVLSILGIIL
jgi:hypothetical protein